ncbi:hypothetical protein [Ktedonosporobacter rubrisoli]|uniref:hypothetical protein n=1 Tax=Ktedonosporobacter rubrisoli TaxID=2509675 RepID=UPI001A939D95|nr:hypothetical protein [Ktedonosporobacter rubrisoli]
MQTLIRPPRPGTPQLRRPRAASRKRFLPAPLIGAIVTVTIILIAGIFFVVQPHFGTQAADDEVKCGLIVPRQPLSAQGLATPYQLVDCNEANADQSAFVQAAILDPATGKVSVYSPLVVNQGQKPAVPPVVPQLPQGAVVGIWFGFNGNVLSLQGQGVQEGNCVKGTKGSTFGQVSFCNATTFFQAANQAIQAGKLVPPQLGTAQDGQPCPTVRDFSVVDQDQSDNVTTAYLIGPNGRMAQKTVANINKLRNTRLLTNGSDNGLLDSFIAPALGCQPWMAPDLADPGHMVTAQALDELQAAAHQAEPVALVPAGDPMVLVDEKPNLAKLNAFRVGVNQPEAQNLNQASTRQYCQDLLRVAPKRFALDAPLLRNSATPDPAAANNLFTFLAQRFNTTWGADGGLNCQGILQLQSPITVQKNDDGVAIKATIGKAQPVKQKKDQDQQDNNDNNKHNGKHHRDQDYHNPQNNPDDGKQNQKQDDQNNNSDNGGKHHNQNDKTDKGDQQNNDKNNQQNADQNNDKNNQQNDDQNNKTDQQNNNDKNNKGDQQNNDKNNQNDNKTDKGDQQNKDQNNQTDQQNNNQNDKGNQQQDQNNKADKGNQQANSQNNQDIQQNTSKGNKGDK